MPADDPAAQLSAATTSQSPPPLEAAAGETASAALVVVHSPDESVIGQRITSTQGVVAFGRDVDPPGVRLEDPQLSRTHFRFAFDGRAATHRLGDAGSRNGTFVDGIRVESATLSLGSVVRAGTSVFVYDREDRLTKVHSRMVRAAPSELTILTLGETGSGKDRLARAVHAHSGRAGPFVALNCAALPRDLIATELFGHTRGAFSGAALARRGLFQAASGGTLFLDEIAELPLELQTTLLRVLQESTVRPVGADEEVRVDVRIIAATHQRLAELVATGRFRADLYARLAQVVIEVPPLRHRRAEILSLARQFASSACAHLQMSADAAEALSRHDWPFNVRELESLVRAFVGTEPGATLDLPYLCEHHGKLVAQFRKNTPLGSGDDSFDPPAPPRHPERGMLEDVLSRHRGNVSAAAEELGKPRAQLYRWLRTLGLDPARYRAAD